jgi:hypothetical protein
MARLILFASALALVASACAGSNPAQELSQQAVCLEHFENDPVERDRCKQAPENQRGTAPDVRPQDLPVRSGQPSD